MVLLLEIYLLELINNSICNRCLHLTSILYLYKHPLFVSNIKTQINIYALLQI